jgi:uncharacterized circularly permuted ATP-grasp superfamily protein
MSKQTAVEWLEECFANHWNYEEHAKWDGLIQQAKQMEKEQMKEYADYAIKQLHETGICFYDEYGNLEDVKGGDNE